MAMSLLWLKKFKEVKIDFYIKKILDFFLGGGFEAHLLAHEITSLVKTEMKTTIYLLLCQMIHSFILGNYSNIDSAFFIVST